MPRALDGSTGKYWCDRTGLQAEGDAGLTVIPSHNKVSIVNALRVYSANDCSNCDPVAYKLEGRSDSNDAWAEISVGNLPSSWIDAAPGRNTQGQDVSSTYEDGDSNLVFTEVSLSSNTVEFVQYRISFTTRDPSSNSLQFAEVELPGVLFEDSDVPIEAPAPAYVQSISCPPVGSSSKVTASGYKIAGPAAANTFCGVFIQKQGSGALIPFSRSYNTNDWEASAGPFASPIDGIACSVDDCDFTLPDLEDANDSYVILTKDGTLDDHRKDIARFLEMTGFGPKMSEIEALDANGNWDDAARAQYVREQIDMDMTSHREYYRKRTNTIWDTTVQEARSDHPCSPNSKWRTYAYTMLDRYDTVSGEAKQLTFETVPAEADLTVTIYEADDAGDVSAHGSGFGGLFRNSRSGYSGTGYYDFGWTIGDFIEWCVIYRPHISLIFSLFLTLCFSSTFCIHTGISMYQRMALIPSPFVTTTMRTTSMVIVPVSYG